MTPMPPGPAMLPAFGFFPKESQEPSAAAPHPVGIPQRCDSATSKVLSAQVRRTSASEIAANFPCGDPKTTQRKV